MSPPSSITSSFDKDTVTAEPGVVLKVILDAKLNKFEVLASFCIQRRLMKVKQAKLPKSRFRGSL